MAVTLRTYLNNKLKEKGMSATQAKKNAGKYSSIAAAKKAGSLYYTNKDGKVMAAVYAGDLKKAEPKPIPRPKVRPKKEPGPLQGPTKRRGTLDEKVEVDKANKKPMGTAALTKMVLVALGPAEVKTTKKKKPKVTGKAARIAELKAEIKKLQKVVDAGKKQKPPVVKRREQARIREIQGIIKRMK